VDRYYIPLDNFDIYTTNTAHRFVCPCDIYIHIYIYIYYSTVACEMSTVQ